MSEQKSAYPTWPAHCLWIQQKEAWYLCVRWVDIASWFLHVEEKKPCIRIITIVLNASFRIRIHWFRIQHLRLHTDPDPDSGFWWLKIGKNLQRKFFLIFFDQILRFLPPDPDPIRNTDWMFKLLMSIDLKNHSKDTQPRCSPLGRLKSKHVTFFVCAF